MSQVTAPLLDRRMHCPIFNPTAGREARFSCDATHSFESWPGYFLFWQTNQTIRMTPKTLRFFEVLCFCGCRIWNVARELWPLRWPQSLETNRSAAPLLNRAAAVFVIAKAHCKSASDFKEHPPMEVGSPISLRRFNCCEQRRLELRRYFSMAAAFKKGIEKAGVAGCFPSNA